MATDEESKSNLEEDFEWNVENEIRLFEAMIGHKPVGINKHFHMACISEKFETLIGKPISSDVIWKHLGSMFDLSTLDKKESLPFPNEIEEFSLPEAEYLDLMNEKLPLKAESVAEIKENIKTSKEPAALKETATKKEKKPEVEEPNLEVDKKESVEPESESKKGKVNKDEKPVKRRGYRSLKDKKPEEETTQTPVSVTKKEEEPTSTSGSNKKEKKQIGKRSLRSRGDDSSSKSSTPPPIKRPRRI